jgi:ribosomal protein L4
MAVATYTKSGTKATTPAKLDKKVFGVEAKSHSLLKSAYLAYLANGRDNLAITKAVTQFGAAAELLLDRLATKTIPIK